MRETEFLRIFDEHHAPLFRFAWRLTGSAADAEDIVQECFLQLLRPGCSYDPERTPIRTYLFGVVRNQSLKRLVRKDLAGDRGSTATPERELLRSETGDVVALAVASLPENQREVLILAHYEQLALDEIAQITGADIGAIKSRLQRARAALRESLANYAPELKAKWERNR